MSGFPVYDAPWGGLPVRFPDILCTSSVCFIARPSWISPLRKTSCRGGSRFGLCPKTSLRFGAALRHTPLASWLPRGSTRFLCSQSAGSFAGRESGRGLFLWVGLSNAPGSILPPTDLFYCPLAASGSGRFPQAGSISGPCGPGDSFQSLSRPLDCSRFFRSALTPSPEGGRLRSVPYLLVH